MSGIYFIVCKIMFDCNKDYIKIYKAINKYCKISIWLNNFEVIELKKFLYFFREFLISQLYKKLFYLKSC